MIKEKIVEAGGGQNGRKHGFCDTSEQKQQNKALEWLPLPVFIVGKLK